MGSFSSKASHTLPYDIEKDFGCEWRADSTPITGIKLLTRGLRGIGLGGLHTALLFETNSKFVVFEYGTKGIEGRKYRVEDQTSHRKDAFESIMGQANKIQVWDIIKYFPTELKLNDVYLAIDGDDIRQHYKGKNYQVLSKNCRKFTKDLCEKIGCNDTGLVFINEFLINIPYIARTKPFEFSEPLKTKYKESFFGEFELNEKDEGFSLVEKILISIYTMNGGGVSAANYTIHLPKQ